MQWRDWETREMVNGMVNVKAGCRLQSNMTSDKPGLTILTVSCNAGSGR